ncbi:protease SohB [Ignatzschineria sp. LJL83]
MVYFIDFILFLAKTATILIGFVAAILFLVSLRSNNSPNSGKLEFKDIGDHFEQIKEGFLEFKDEDEDKKPAEKKKDQTATKADAENSSESDATLTADSADEMETEKSQAVNSEKETTSSKKFWQFWKKAEAPKFERKEKTLYVLEFDGDVHAEEVKNLREEVSALLHIAEKGDEVLLKLTSPGGAVNSYGLAASQLVRIREKGLNLTVAVDEVAASGGYLMACVANHIVAAPFAIVGSIGVVAELPNFHKVLEKYNIDYEQFTAGEYKRTVTMFGENTEEAKEKFKDELNEIHLVFKDFVHQYRPSLDIKTIATGEYWLAVKALELGLVDELSTSDTYILDAIKDKNVYSVKYVEKTTVRQGISRFLTRIMKRIPF